MAGTLAGKTLFISGASRGIGKAIALRAAKDGANVVIAAKTAETHSKLPGTIFSAAEEVEKAGGRALAVVCDIRSEEQVRSAVDSAVKKFGGIDILVNNASAISLTGTLETPMKKFDLMFSVNVRGTYLCSQACIPHLLKSKNPHILNLSPPLSLRPVWFRGHVAYSMAKYGMSMCVLGMSEELRDRGIAVNALWPKTAIHTAAMEMLTGYSEETKNQCRKPEIMADAAHAILTKSSRTFTGNFCVDEKILKEAGTTDFSAYAYDPKAKLLPDFFLDENEKELFQLLNSMPGSRPASASAPASGSEAGSAKSDVEKVFDTVRGVLTEEAVKQTNAVFAFDLAGAAGSEQWFLDLKTAKKGAVGRGAPPSGAAGVTFSMKSDDFVKLFRGELNSMNLFMSGRMKLKGDLSLAMKLEKLLTATRKQAKL